MSQPPLGPSPLPATSPTEGSGDVNLPADTGTNATPVPVVFDVDFDFSVPRRRPNGRLLQSCIGEHVSLTCRFKERLNSGMALVECSDGHAVQVLLPEDTDLEGPILELIVFVLSTTVVRLVRPPSEMGEGLGK
ncbi:hypothetical protein CALCODRAFT_489100 [Calocera cornea HHB12733]|uniref:Uncharacterized protein n=1 Tax=Calocera cornea HHB12733 TaxID=1353952 RepID=A0A166LBQ2_9BASI|nr:hypothetical protein CALCODRAFT_489100 [Calocera cornea HHB12733]